MESAFRLLLAILILIVVFGVPLYFCFRGMIRQARLGNVDRFKMGADSSRTLAGLGISLFFPLVPIMLYRHAWFVAAVIALLSGAIFFIGLRTRRQA